MMKKLRLSTEDLKKIDKKKYKTQKEITEEKRRITTEKIFEKFEESLVNEKKLRELKKNLYLKYVILKENILNNQGFWEAHIQNIINESIFITLLIQKQEKQLLPVQQLWQMN